MAQKLILIGDINLMAVDDSTAPFAEVSAELQSADFVFANLECCLHDAPRASDGSTAGYFAGAKAGGDALQRAGIGAVGLANNVNFSDAAILDSIERLDQLAIAHTGAGINAAAAKVPVLLEKNGVRVGVMQRTSVYWPSNHEAGRHTPGVAALRGNTAYQMPLHKTRPGMSQCNRPGVPPLIVTWVDPPYLKAFSDDVAALRENCDILVASCHWGLGHDVLDYMQEAAHTAIDAGADIVLGHGPHYILPVEIYRGKPIFYGMGNFCFSLRPDGSRVGDWVGTLARFTIDGGEIAGASLQFVRHDDANRTLLRRLSDESAAFAALAKACEAYGTRLVPRGDEIDIDLTA